MTVPRLMISAAHKSSGKSVVSAGLAAAFGRRGETVSVFKKGPDYIDPMWLSRAAGRAAYNLDFNTMSRPEILRLFAAKSAGSDLALIEANKGLYDGFDPEGKDCNAALAHLLGAPVVLVIDARGMTRGIAPLLQGYVGFDHGLEIAGVILNRTGGTRHERKLRQAVESYTDLDVLGAIRETPELDISERHLGLTVPAELSGVEEFLEGAARIIASSVDLDRVSGAAKRIGKLKLADAQAADLRGVGAGLKIGIARDAAFGFYYPDDLEAFEALGAQLVPIDMLRDPGLPEIDGLFIGGGFPETQMGALSANVAMRRSVREALECGLPAYAECGGLMYLCRSISWRDETRPMVGFIEADAVMHARPQGRGYVRFAATNTALWSAGAAETKAHEFHYASLENMTSGRFARRILRGRGIDGTHDGVVKSNTTAGFIHLRNTAATPWVARFLGFVAACRETKIPAPSARGSA
ncbi:cobyrinate a,c-diamide synthase [Ruegeria marina]|uniref:Hydrogenobyrinic acid a,c-diamide synthase (Glutamine-hydrolysing) n=1 Tax=Ruegeria marina TaxID=639004 RepID=A0A1G6S634_9RHOB|nr:cobyrinate a,c-diamide synthase [Ruegeria marina]SDD12392.1 hydrogenobyrinic acid a,c-diamide synthase (glutamine-hydrolysing) [Ruegeria marina]